MSCADQEISVKLTQELLTAFESFSVQILKKEGFNPALAQMPIKVCCLILNNCKKCFISFLYMLVTEYFQDLGAILYAEVNYRVITELVTC